MIKEHILRILIIAGFILLPQINIKAQEPENTAHLINKLIKENNIEAIVVYGDETTLGTTYKDFKIEGQFLIANRPAATIYFNLRRTIKVEIRKRRKNELLLYLSYT